MGSVKQKRKSSAVISGRILRRSPGTGTGSNGGCGVPLHSRDPKAQGLAVRNDLPVNKSESAFPGGGVGRGGMGKPLGCISFYSQG